MVEHRNILGSAEPSRATLNGSVLRRMAGCCSRSALVAAGQDHNRLRKAYVWVW